MINVNIVQVGKGYIWTEDTDGAKVDGQVVWDTPQLAKKAYQDYLQVELVSHISAKRDALAKDSNWQGNTLQINSKE